MRPVSAENVMALSRSDPPVMFDTFHPLKRGPEAFPD